MTPLECAKAIAGPIASWGGKFMLDPATFAKAAEVGASPDDEYTRGREPSDSPPLQGMSSYLAGRFGVLGDATSEQVVAAAAFFNPEHTATEWDKLIRHVNPTVVAEKYYAPCAFSWGRENLPNSADLDRFCQLAEKIVTVASPAQAPVFVGWRNIQRPEDSPAAATLLIHLLRELRFARHVTAVQADGMAPLEAILSGPGGEGNAELFMWAKPFPDVSHLTERRAQVEEETHRLCAQDMEVLSESERQELADILNSLGS